ncbi:hypothetical protein ACQJBY_007396 [Aegilops geniculata]
MVNTSAAPNSTYCGTIHHRLIGTGTLGRSARPASAAIRSRRASTSAATTIDTSESTIPTPMRCSMVMPEETPVQRRASGTMARS